MDSQQAQRRRRGGLRTLLWAQLGELIGFGVLLFIIYQLYEVFQPFVDPIAWAIILGLTFHPVHRRLHTLVGGRPNLAAFLATIVVLLTVVVPALALSGMLSQEASQAIQQLRHFVEAGGLERWGEQFRMRAWIPVWEWLNPWLGSNTVDLRGMVLRGLNSLANVVVEQVTLVAAGILLMAVKFILMLMTLFFVFRDGESCYLSLRQMLPLSAAQQRRLFDRLGETVTAVTRGIGITAVVQGVLAGLMYWMLGVPFAALWGLLTALVAPIPIGGTGLIWGPVVFYLIVAQSWVKGVILLGWGLLVVSTIDNVLRPWLIGERTQLSTLFLFFAILGGVKAYGILGIFLGPLLLALVMTGITLYRETVQDAQPAEEPKEREEA